MKSVEKEIQYTITNTYSTLNKVTNKTKNVWFVCHGLGFLSRYFIKYFKTLNPEENYIIAPQASAKQYLNGKFTHVGASWLTKENTKVEMQNVIRNFDAIMDSEGIPDNVNFIVLGFSQGVSVVTRWLAQNNRPCHKLVLYAGKVPREFETTDFAHVEKVLLYVGDQDEYIREEMIEDEMAYLNQLFKEKITYHVFNGTHEMKFDLVEEIEAI